MTSLDSTKLVVYTVYFLGKTGNILSVDYPFQERMNDVQLQNFLDGPYPVVGCDVKWLHLYSPDSFDEKM